VVVIRNRASKQQESKKASSSCSTAMGGVGKAGGVGKRERGDLFGNGLRHRLLSSSTARRWLAWHGFSRGPVFRRVGCCRIRGLEVGSWRAEGQFQA
jgi:hypothetical protein